MKRIDLRSDTVTLPTEKMRRAMADAELGDDVYGEDPTVNRLQEMAAERLGKEAGLFIPSGTMGNLIAVLTHCGRGDEVIMGTHGHTFLHEAGGISALGGVSPSMIPNKTDGTLDLDDIRHAVRADDIHEPRSKLLILENTQNACGGMSLSREYMLAASAVARENNLALHLDGARVFNAAVDQGVPVVDLVDMVDSVTFCLSKGLCAPVGSVLCGSKPFIAEALRIRKQLGGGMRQAGVLAAAGIVALEEMVDRLAEDHANARELAQGLSAIEGVRLDKGSPNTNMVYVELAPELGISAEAVESALQAEGVLAGITGPRHFRLVCHYWIKDDDLPVIMAAFKKALNRA
ncbi:MAG TPA: low-specificity L-threonine aldolase [Anaerolineaceae bacterium]|nr:low-specificity L-threonine aldolase [Anaerolineaceae bacterium]